MNDHVPPDIAMFGIKAEYWYYLAKLTHSELKELGALAKERVERRELERLKEKYEG